MATRDYRFFAAPGSADIVGTSNIGAWDVSSVTSMQDMFRGVRGNEELLINKITELLHKEFGEMSLSVSIAPQNMELYYEVRVSYGINGSRHICVQISRDNFKTTLDNYGLRSAAEVTADELIRHIRKDITDTMFGSEIKRKAPKNEAIKKEKAFRKILI